MSIPEGRPIAATVIEKFLDANHTCDCGTEDYCPGNADEAYSLALDVLEAAAPHMVKDLRELIEDMEAQPSSEMVTVRGMASLIRNTMKGLL